MRGDDVLDDPQLMDLAIQECRLTEWADIRDNDEPYRSELASLTDCDQAIATDRVVEVER